MRRKQRKTGDDAALQLLARAPEHFLATVTSDGEPILRCLNGVVVDDWLLFHGALVGEKTRAFGQRAVATAQEVIADIPSTFSGCDKACPATTYYRSAQVKGTLVDVASVELKRRMLQGLMEKLQPEGGYVPFIVTEAPGMLRAPAGDAPGCPYAGGEDFYKNDLKAVRVFGFQFDEVVGKANLGQDKPPEFTRAIVEQLFKRGKAGDLAAIEVILELSPSARPSLLVSKEAELTLHVFPLAQDIHAHAQLVSSEYWREGVALAQIESSILHSSAWVGAKDADGRLVGAARAVTDRSWTAMICDVIVEREHRGRGLGKKLVALLLDHPLVRDCRTQRLGTRGAEGLYEAFGFQDAELMQPPGHTQMVRRIGH